jgi:hypothetical protein
MLQPHPSVQRLGAAATAVVRTVFDETDRMIR